MSFFLNSMLLAASQNDDLARQWRWIKRHYGPYFDPTLASLIAIGIFGLLAIWLLSRWRAKDHKPIDNSELLYRELCRAHRLTWSQRSMLHKIAIQQRLEDPSVLFVEPTYLKQAAKESRKPRQKQQCEQLQQKLFG